MARKQGKKLGISCFNSSMQGWRLLETEVPFYGFKTKPIGMDTDSEKPEAYFESGFSVFGSETLVKNY
jgi:hypothetical protein